MFKLFVSAFLFLAIVLFSPAAAFAQDSNDFHVVHVQKWTLKSNPTGDESKAFNEMLKKQSGVFNSDSRVVSSYILRHFWGADSRDLIMVTEFKNSADLFSFFDDLTPMMEKAFSQEERDKDDALFNKYVGHHSDEVYQLVDGTKK